MLALWLLCSVVLSLGPAYAQSTGYVYDANGRVVAVTASNGTSVQYSYNSLGHTNAISTPLPAGQVAIFSFMPTHGKAQTQVAIQGQGFDSNAANDTVSFNGTVATVLSASPTQLVTTVPSGATTGPISVTVGGQTAASSMPFMMDDTGMPPSITQVSPAAVAVGGTLTIAGAYLDPVAGKTTSQMGGRDIGGLTAASDVQLQYAVSSNATSGYVTVTTPYGFATSSTPIVVVPAGINPASVVSSGTAIVDGSGANLTIGASGQIGAVTFTAPQAGWVSLQTSGITTTASSIAYTVYATGNSVIQQGALSALSPSIHLPHLAAGSTYLVLIQPNGGGAQMTMGVETNTQLALNTTATVVTTVPSQSKRVLFNAGVGQNLTLLINGTSTNPAGQTASYTVYTPSGSTYASGSTAATGVLNLGIVPVAGIYQVVIAPPTGVTGTMQVEVAPAISGVLSGAPQTYAGNMAGQNVYLSFDATQGENLELTLNNASVAGARTNDFAVNVYNASGTQIASFYCFPGSPGASCMQPLWNMTAGHYSVIVSPVDGGTVRFNALLQDDISGPTVAAGASTNIALGAGQVERLSFSANQGDTIALNVSGVTTVPNGQSVTFLVYRPDAGTITSSTATFTSFSTSSSQTVNLPNLPVSGNYTVIVEPSYGLPASAQFNVIAAVQGSLSENGATQAYSASVVGQNVYLSFTATQNENLELALNNISVPGASQNDFAVNVYNSAGTQITSIYCFGGSAGSSCIQPLWNLAAGTYSVIVAPVDGGTVHFNALLQDDIIGPPVAVGGSTNIALDAGQVERFNFYANQGDTVALNVAGVTTTPNGQSVSFQVYRPDAGAITSKTATYTSFTTSSSQTVNLPSLPVSGAYTVIVQPGNGLAATAQFSILAGADGTISASSGSQTYAGSVVGQNAYLTFTAAQGENLELTLNNASVTGARYNDFYVAVTNQVGTQIVGFYCFPGNTHGSCTQHLWDLAAGSYLVTVAPIDGGSMSFSALLQDDIVGQTLTAGSQSSMNLMAGQVERLSFVANAGDTVQLQAYWLTQPATNTGTTFLVYRPDTGTLTNTTTPLASYDLSSQQTFNVANVPVSGTYTVVVAPDYGLPQNVQLADLDQYMSNPPTYGTPTLADDGSIHPEASAGAGQSVTMGFNANEGDNLEFTLSGLVISNSGNNSVSVNVLDPNGTKISSVTCATSSPGNSCRLPLWNLRAGTYSIAVSPPDSNAIINFNALLQPDATGQTLTYGATTNVNLAAGEVARLTFNANVGDSVALALSGISTTAPAGQPLSVQIYRPDTGAVSSSNYYSTFTATTSSIVNLPNLPASGAYSVVVSTPAGTPGAGQLSLMSLAPLSLPEDGTSQSYAPAFAGQHSYANFTANQGDNLELTLSNIVTSGTSWWININIYSANGVNVGGGSCNNAAICRVPLWNLAAGTYTVLVSPPDATTKMSFALQLQPDLIGPSLAANSPVALNLTQGQVERFTFSANLGDSVALALTGVSTTPKGQTAYVNIYRPDMGAITTGNAYASFNTTGSNLINLMNLPVGGTYTVVVYTTGMPMTAQLNLVPVATSAMLSSDGSSQSYAASILGESLYTNFVAQQGDNLELTVSNVVVTGTSWNANINVYNASGVKVLAAGCNNAATCRMALWNLAAGTYTVVFSPADVTTKFSLTAQLQPDTTGPALVANTPAAITLGQGQLQRLTFNASVGDTVTLSLSGITTVPTGQTVYVDVYRPDTGPLVYGKAYASFNTTSSNSITLGNLPVGGVYRAIIYTAGGPATAQLTMGYGASGTLPILGSLGSFATTNPGQPVNVSFYANAGANLELTLSNISTSGANTNGFEVTVRDPAGRQIANFFCYASSPGASCTQPLWNLTAGTYSVSAVPVFGGTISFSAQLQQDLTGAALTSGNPADIALQAGQAERVTFSANQGANVIVQLAGVSTTPANQSIYADVYRPDVDEIDQGNAFARFQANSANSLSLSNLPIGGTYTVVLHTSTGIQAEAQISYTAQ